MTLAEALLPQPHRLSGVVAFVGAGGKTTAMLRLARELEALGRRVIVTTTTHLRDPREEPGGPAGRVVFRPEMERPYAVGPEAAEALAGLDEATAAAARPGLAILVAREADDAGKVKGIHPSWVPELRRSHDVVLVEADGSKRLPLKAPAPWEPVLPPDPDLVVGVLGLDGLGRPMDGRTVHRPERFALVTGCEPGAPVSWTHLEALVAHPEGLFKGASAARAVLLNKLDMAPFAPSAGQVAGLDVERVLLCRLEGEPSVTLYLKKAGPPCR